MNALRAVDRLEEGNFAYIYKRRYHHKNIFEMPPKDTIPTNESAAQIKQSIPDYGLERNKKSKEAHVGNKNYGVGGTA